MCLHHEGPMIGVQYQLMICRGCIRASKGAFKFFGNQQLTIKSNFAFLSPFQVEFERVRMSKIISVVNLNMIYQVPV